MRVPWTAPLLLAASVFAPLAMTASARAEDPMERPLHAFFDSLRKAEDPKAARVSKIAYYGDSAIISDGFTGELRSRLQGRFGDAGAGFLLAGPTFDDYRHQGLKYASKGWSSMAVIAGDVKSGRYGYGGVVATSFGGAATSFESKGEFITSIEVYYEAIPKGGNLQVFLNGETKKSADQIATAADKPTPRVWRFTPEGGVKKVRIRAGGEGLVKVYGVVLNGKSKGVQLDALGILGMRARRWLNADADHVRDQVATRSPDLVVLHFGGNERVDENLSKAGHQADIEKTVALLKAGAPHAACLIVGPLAQGEEKGGKIVYDKSLDDIYPAQREAAKRAGCAFFDTLAAMGGKSALASWRKNKWLEGDYAHLTAKGHKALGDLMAKWMLGLYDTWKTHTASR